MSNVNWLHTIFINLFIVLIYFSTEPSLYFGEPEYVVDESSGYVEVKVWRTGTDLSKTATVTVRSRKSEPLSAEGTNHSWSRINH